MKQKPSVSKHEEGARLVFW